MHTLIDVDSSENNGAKKEREAGGIEKFFEAGDKVGAEDELFGKGDCET